MPKDKQQNLKDAERQKKSGKLLGPGHFFYPVKTSFSIAAYREAEVFSQKQLREYLEAWARRLKLDSEVPTVAVQKKYDGVSCFLHRDSTGRFYAFSEDGSDITPKVVPTLNFVLKEHPDFFPEGDFIVLGELELWDKDKHLGREDVAGSLHRKGESLNPEQVVWNLHDLLWLNGEDLHAKTYHERFTRLQKAFNFYQSTLGIPKERGFNLAKTFVCDRWREVSAAVERCVNAVASEGAMVKLWDGFKYELDGTTSELLKYKKYVEAHFLVIDKRKIKGTEKTYQYWIGVPLRPPHPDVDPDHVVEICGQKVLIVGKTFNTNVQAKVCDVITVTFHNVFVHKNDDGTIRVGVYEPRVYENRSAANPDEEPDDLNSLLRIGRESGLLVEKAGEIVTVDPFLVYPDESKRHDFIIHIHYRGRTAHGDLRLEGAGDYLIGYTLMIQKPGVIKEPVTTLEKAKELAKDESLWKFSPYHGTFEREKDRRGVERYVSIETALKAPEPLEWMTFEGVVEPGHVGATRNYPGVFFIAAKGQVEYGFRTPYFHEYFLINPRWKEPVLHVSVRLLDVESLKRSRESFIARLADLADKWCCSEDEVVETLGIVADELTVTKYGEVVFKLSEAPSEEEERTPFIWLFIKNVDLIPYILSNRAVQKSRIPPYGVSALPRWVRSQIPETFHYWKERNEEKRLQVRDALVEAIKSKKVKIDWDAWVERTRKESPLQAEFQLRRRWWRGPIVVRTGPTVELFDLILTRGKLARVFTLHRNPAEHSSVSGVERKLAPGELELVSRKGDQVKLDPEHALNPNKEVDAHLELLDKGQATVFIDEPDLVKVRFDGDELEGLYLFERDEGTNVWWVRRTSTVGGKRDE